MQECKITVSHPDGSKDLYRVPEETKYKEIAALAMQSGKYPDDIILAMVDGKLGELNKKIRGNHEVSFLTTANIDGRRAYRRSLVMLLQCAVTRKYGMTVQLRVLLTIGEGYYCQLFDADGQRKEGISAEDLADLKKIMESMVREDIPIRKRNVSTRKAEKLFGEYGQHDKERLFHYRRSSRTNLYEISGYNDYFYGFMAPSTGMLKVYELECYRDGFFLLFPGKDTRTAEPFAASDKLFQVLMDSRQWSRKLGVGNIGNLNDAIAQGRGQELILLQEALMEAKIGELAEKIANDRRKKFVMIAGPSSSGKTSFANRLSIQLTAKGVVPHPVSLDDYYLNRDRTPRNPDGSYDFECLESLDIEQFNKDMTCLLRGERVNLPSYNFKTGCREYRGNSLQLGSDDILVIEGIHGLNDRLSYTLPAESKFKIYISALSQLNVDEHNPLSTTDGRLIRRIVRDNRTRNTSAKETIAMWPKVRRGEQQNIFPFQESADVMFNSALVYELAVLKVYAEPLLFQIEQGEPEYLEAQRLLKFLDYLLPLPAEGINNNSLMREFVGGSCFNV